MGAMPRLRIADLLAAAPVDPDAHLDPARVPSATSASESSTVCIDAASSRSAILRSDSFFGSENFNSHNLQRYS